MSKGLKLVSFTVDPERDSVWVLSEYAKGWGAIDGKWFFITGEKKNIYELARKGFILPVEEGDGGPNDFIHSDRVVLVDSKGRIRGYYSGTDPEDVDKLRLLDYTGTLSILSGFSFSRFSICFKKQN